MKQENDNAIDFDSPSFHNDETEAYKMMDYLDKNIITPDSAKSRIKEPQGTLHIETKLPDVVKPLLITANDNIPAKNTNTQPLITNTNLNLPSFPQLAATVQQIDNFEKKIKKKNFDYNHAELIDSDHEEELLDNDVDPLIEKNQLIARYKLIQTKIKEKNQQIQTLIKEIQETKKKNAEFIEMISKEKNIEIKDKKLIEFAKKNQDLNLKLEKHKLKEKSLEKKLKEMQNEINKISISNKEEYAANVMTPVNNEELCQVNDLKKKLKQSEAKIVETRNKLQSAKEENTKLNILIKREIGETIDINKALVEKGYWKGRAEMIESLKAKIKSLESQIAVSNAGVQVSQVNNNNLTTTEIETSKVTQGNIISSNMVPYSEYKKEKETMRGEVERLTEQIGKLSNENSRLSSRKTVLEKELKLQKEELTEKLKILIDKSDNDEKLIVALQQELERRGHRFVNSGFENSVFNLQQEIAKLRQELKEKEEYINNLNSLMIPDTRKDSTKLEKDINTQTMNKILTKLKELEVENKTLRDNSEDGKIYEALARENAKLRLKIKDLESRLSA